MNNETDKGMEEERIEDVLSDEVMIEETGIGVQVFEEQEEQHEVVEEVRRWANGQPQWTNSLFGTWTKWEAETGQLREPLPQEYGKPSLLVLFAKLKQEHDLAKAVKLDAAEVQVNL